MPANFIKGDILAEAESSAGRRALVFGAEGGIAAAVMKRWPAFAKALEDAKSVQPGEVFAWSEGDLHIFALGIRRGEGKPKVPWIERSFKTVIERAGKEGIARILVPRLGGDWTRVKKVLVEIGATTTIDLVVFEQFVRKSATTDGAEK